MHRFITFLLVLILLAIPSFAAPTKTVKVGAFDLYPGIFRTSDGSIQGFYVDLLAEVAKREGWQLRYVFGAWADIPGSIAKGEIDLVPGVARREGRTTYLDLASVPVVTLSGEVYVPATSSTVAIRQLAGKRVGVMAGCINGTSFRTTVQNLGMPCDIVTFPTYDELFRAVSTGRVDAGVADNVFGAAKQHEYQLKSSGIVLTPFDIYFAVAKGQNADLLAVLDKYLKEWRAEDNSPYHKALQRWGHPGVPLPYTPDWVMRTVVTLLILSALGCVSVFFLRAQVRRKKQEITAQTREKEKIEETLRLKNFTLENIHDAVFWIVPDGRICDANAAAARLSGYPRDGLLNRTFPGCAALTDGEWEARVQELRSTGSVDFDTTLRTGDGGAIDVEVSASYFSYQDRDYICAIVHDIRERRRSEALLMEYRKVIECSSDLICVVDSDYRYRLANSAFLHYWQKPLEEVVGHTVEEVVGSSALSEIKPQIECCLGGAQVTYQKHFNYPGKGKRLMTLSYTPLEGSDGRPLIACVIRDETEHELLETQLRQAQKMEAIGHLAGGIAHDFNNILTVIIGYGNILLARADELDERQKAEVEQIIAASQRAASLTRGLLAFSRKQVLSPQKVALNDIVNNLQSFLLRIIGEDIHLKFVHHTPHLAIFADRGQIEQVIMNLATNARDAMPEGGMLAVEVSRQTIDPGHVHAHGYGEPGEYACLIVSDTGVGMDKETQEKIFEPFFSTKEMGRGTGLGMAIVYGIVKQHKGFINVYSEPGEGTTFRIYLPLVDQEKGASASESAQAVPAGGSETILVAEDDSTVSKLVETVLKEFGYTVILAVDGNDCVQKFAANREKVDLVLMDMIMPGKSGKEACAEIREMQPDVPVLYSSGYTADFMHGRGLLDPGVDLIMKPVEPMVLLSKVREVLDRDASIDQSGLPVR